MSQTQTKPKKLWGKPKVFMSASHLIIEERYYALAQTRGAYVEPVPQEEVKAAANKTEPPQTPADSWSTFRKTVMIVVGIVVAILVILFIAWWNDGYNTYGSGGSAKKYRLMLVSEYGPVVALEHSNEKKLKEIASEVNNYLSSQGITPQSGYLASNR